MPIRAAREADGAIRVAQEVAEKQAEEARAEREQARLNAEIVVNIPIHLTGDHRE